MDPVQLTIVIVCFLITGVILILSIQVWHILKEMRISLQKVNKMLDDGGKITGVVSQSALSIAGIVSGIKAGANILSIFRPKGDNV
jgi:hypothetical protein